MLTSLRSIVVLAAAATLAAATSANASIIHYANVSGGVLSITNITETNDNGSGVFNYGDAGAPSYYGPASLNASTLTLSLPITGTLPFASSATGPDGSDILGVKLAFDLTSTVPIPVAAFVTEVGDYFASGGGIGGDDSSILIFDSSSDLLASGTGAYNPAAGTTSAVWTDTAGATGNGLATSFHVVIDNVLHTAAPAPTDFAFIEKKALTISIGTGGSPGTPEPASLGVLGLGALALINRRRKA
jgi:hypothetical protein